MTFIYVSSSELFLSIWKKIFTNCIIMVYFLIVDRVSLKRVVDPFFYIYFKRLEV